MMHKHKARIWLGMAVIFLSGVLIGATGHRLYMKNKIDRIMHADSQHLTEIIMKGICGDLDLTPEEQAKFTPIIKTAARDLLNLRREQQCQADSILERAMCDNKKNLCREKQEKLDELWGKFKARQTALSKE